MSVTDRIGPDNSTMRAPSRIRAVRATGLLDAPADESFDRLTRVAVNVLAVDAAAISLVDETRSFYLSQTGLPEPLASAREHPGPSLCHYVLQHGSTLSIPDVTLHEGKSRVPVVTGMGIRAYAGVPLRMRDGEAIGTFCAIHSSPREWTQRDLSLLEDLSLLVIAEIERRQSEKALRASEERYRNLLDGIPVGLYRTSADGRFLDANDAMVTLLGYPDRESLLAMDVPDLYVNPQDRRRWSAQLARDRIVRGFEFQLRRRDGKLLWVRDTTHARTDPTGAVLYYEGSLEDITEARDAKLELQRREELYRALIEKSHDIITVLDANGQITYESPAVEAVLDYAPEELVGRNVFEFIHPEDSSRIMSELGALIAEPGGVASVRLRFQHRSGAWRVIEATGTNLLDSSSVAGVVVNSRDVTVRVEMEEQLRQASKMEAVGRLAGGVAHDFNNLLTGIRGITDLLIEDLADRTDAVQDLHAIRNAADRATGLTRQLLAFGRRQILHPRPTDLNEAVRRLRTILRSLVGEQIEIITDLSPALGTTIVDPAQIEQVIMNLVINARDAIEDTGAITIATSNVDLPDPHMNPPSSGVTGQFVRLDVRDTGTGIPGDVLPHIFEPFFTTKSMGSGTGLGLSTVIGIVQQSGGFVWAEPQPVLGTVFHVLLPRAPESAPSSLTASEPAVDGVGTILIVDDEETVLKVAQRMLVRLGYTVTSVSTGPEALAAARGMGTIDVLLTDVVMPGMTGPELARRMSAIHPETRIVYMSGHTQESVGGDGAFFIQKPFDLGTLSARVAEAVAAK